MDDDTARIWAPQRGPQTILIRCHVAQDILFGGARGGGKTDGVLGDWLFHLERYGEYASGLFVRPTYPELYEAVTRAKRLFRDIGSWNEAKSTFSFNGGGVLRFRHLKFMKDAEAHQGENNTWVNIEEMGNYPDPDIPDLLRATLRSVNRVTCRFLGTANPGGRGHNWVKARYIDPAPPFTPFDAPLGIPGHEDETVRRIFIPARLKDNKILQNSDPNYWRNVALAAGGQEWLLKAWLDGDWNITAGGMFDDVWKAEIHILKPFAIPGSWRVYRAFDWGSSKPFSVGWWAVSDGSEARMADGSVRFFYPGSVIRIGEFYGWNGRPNKGCRMGDAEIAAQIVSTEKTNRKYWGWAPDVQDGPADSSIFVEENGRSIADLYRPFGIKWKKSDKSPGSRVAGWRQLRELLAGAIEKPPERPGLFTFDTCRHFIRTFPSLPRDDKKLDDVDTKSEDHIGDETRYMVRFLDRRPLRQLGIGV